MTAALGAAAATTPSESSSACSALRHSRAEPTLPETDQPMQQAIVQAAMGGEDALAILPTGTGKSLCYQLPALSRYDKTGALTVVLSPLVALMADQVAGLQRPGDYLVCHR